MDVFRYGVPDVALAVGYYQRRDVLKKEDR